MYPGRKLHLCEKVILKIFLVMWQIEKKKSKSSRSVSGNGAVGECSYLLLAVPRIAQALMADFPKEVCEKCVDPSHLGSVIS